MPNQSLTHLYIDSIFTNVTFTKKSNDVVYNQTHLGFKSTSEPTMGAYKLGQTVKNSLPVSGGYIGWVCVTEGIANSSTWKSSSTFTTGTKINANGYVYEAQNNGKPVKTSPTLPTMVGNVVEDMAGTSTWVSKDYAVGDIVIPTVSNGFFYECTAAGTSGVIEPTWVTTAGSKVVDGTVNWTARKIITWKNIGVKAEFKTYGLIS